MRCDVLLWDDVCKRGKAMLRAMADAAPIECAVTDGAPSGADLLMTWGLGHVGRRPLVDAHLARGGRVVGWDLGYWGRRPKTIVEQPYRLTIDHDHPWRMIGSEPAGRFDSSGIVLREDAKPSGPILFACLGNKARKLYPSWEPTARRRLAGRHVEMRPKSSHLPPIAGALRGKSLAVVRHSNVAVDACIAGVPVECEDGAAYALYRDNPAPSRELRLEFLRSLAWWQWKPSEAAQAWTFILRKLSA